MTESSVPVIFLSTRAPWPPVTGHFMRTYRILEGLAQSHPVHLLAFFDKGLSTGRQDEVRSHLSPVCASLHLETAPAEAGLSGLLRALVQSLLQLKPFVARKYHSASMARALHGLLAEHPHAVVCADMLPLVEYLSGVDPRRFILTTHNLESQRLRSLAAAHGNPLVRLGLNLQARLLARYEAAAMQRLRHCITVSPDDAAWFRPLGPACTVYVVPNGAEVPAASLARARSGAPVALWVGGMADAYNAQAVDFFAQKVLPRVLVRCPDLVWHVVGKHPTASVLDAQRQLPQNVRISGFVEELADVYSTADLVVASVRSGAGTKLKVLEALATGVPVVTTTVGAEGLGLVSGEHALIADTPDGYAAAVCSVVEQPAIASAMGLRGRLHVVESFDWRDITARNGAIVDDVAAAWAAVPA